MLRAVISPLKTSIYKLRIMVMDDMSSKPLHSAFEPAPNQERGLGLGRINATASEILARRTKMINGAINLWERIDVSVWIRQAYTGTSSWASGRQELSPGLNTFS